MLPLLVLDESGRDRPVGITVGHTGNGDMHTVAMRYIQNNEMFLVLGIHCGST